MREAEVIARLRRIATHEAARGLLDDVAVLDGLAITHDTIVEGIHFLSTDPPASVGWKLVTVNLSDLAAKGAAPAGALLSLTMAGDPAWDEEFLTGLEHACESYGLPLLGGDTVTLPPASPRVLGLTAMGKVTTQAPGRDGARDGDRIWLVGALGDAGAGLEQLRANPRASGHLVDIYRRPIPQLAAGRALAPLASAMMDVSDGLLLDASRMAAASGLEATIDLDALPLSEEFRAERGDSRESRMFAATGGDDYALLAAVPSEIDATTLNLPSGTTMACIGRFVAGEPGIRLTCRGTPIETPERLGYEHRGDHSAPMAYRP